MAACGKSSKMSVGSCKQVQVHTRTHTHAYAHTSSQITERQQSSLQLFFLFTCTDVLDWRAAPTTASNSNAGWHSPSGSQLCEDT